MADEQDATLLATLIEGLRYRWRTFAAFGVLAVLAFVGSVIWRAVGDRVAADPRYRITVDSIETTPPPAWVRSDVRSQVLAGAGLRDGLSGLSPPDKLEQQLADAFRFHPWVRSVGQISKRPPNRLKIELEYRVPLAAVGEASRPGELLLADAEGFRLPESDLSAAELRHLPRVTLPDTIQALATQQAARPLLGEPWSDIRVHGAVRLVTALGDAWWDLGLARVTPGERVEVRGDYRYFAYELISVGGTRIAWGAAPGAEPPGEPPFGDKRQRLLAYHNGGQPLNGPLAPSFIDLRTPRIHVQPRISKKDTEPRLSEKPEPIEKKKQLK